MKSVIGVALVPLLVATRVAGAQLVATVPASDPVYDAVMRAASVLPVPGIVSGQRPWSRREVARIAGALERAVRERRADSFRARVPPAIADLVDSIAAAYAPEIAQLDNAGRPGFTFPRLRSLTLRGTGADADSRAVPQSNGLGSISAVTNPLVEPNRGHPVAHGATADVEPLIESGIGTHVAAGVQPRFTWLAPTHQQGSWQSVLQRLYARAVFGNVAVEAGFDDVLWGQGGERGLLLSANPRPLHALTVSNDTATTLPGFLRRLGPMHATFMIASLGNDQNFPGAQLVNYKVSFSPTQRLEIGGAMLDQMGGSGSPPCSLTCRAKDLFPYVFWMFERGSEPQASNKIAGVDLRYRIPEARALTLYYELSMDDFDLRRTRSMLWQDSGHLLGATFDRLDDAGRWSLDVQAHHTSLRLYEHLQYTSGVTYRQSIIGDPLGPHAEAAYSRLTYRPSLPYELNVEGAFESRDASIYAINPGDVHGNGWQFIETSDLPKERRARATLSLEHSVLGVGIDVEPKVAIERVTNNGFVAGQTRTNALAALTVRLAF